MHRFVRPAQSPLFFSRRSYVSFTHSNHFKFSYNLRKFILQQSKALKNDKNYLKLKKILKKSTKRQGIISRAIGFGVGTGIYCYLSPKYYCTQIDTETDVLALKFEEKAKEESKTVWSIIWETIKENKWLVLIALIINVLNSIFPFFLPAGLANFLSIVKNGGHIQELIKQTLILIATGLGSGCLQMLDYVLLSEFIANVQDNLSTYLFQILLRQDIVRFLPRPPLIPLPPPFLLLLSLPLPSPFLLLLSLPLPSPSLILLPFFSFRLLPLYSFVAPSSSLFLLFLLFILLTRLFLFWE